MREREREREREVRTGIISITFPHISSMMWLNSVPFPPLANGFSPLNGARHWDYASFALCYSFFVLFPSCFHEIKYNVLLHIAVREKEEIGALCFLLTFCIFASLPHVFVAVHLLLVFHVFESCKIWKNFCLCRFGFKNN